MAWTGATLHDQCHSEPKEKGDKSRRPPGFEGDSERGRGLGAGRPRGARPGGAEPRCSAALEALIRIKKATWIEVDPRNGASVRKNLAIRWRPTASEAS